MFKKILTSFLLTLVALGGFFGVSLDTQINQTGVENIVATIGINQSYAKCADGNEY